MGMVTPMSNAAPQGNLRSTYIPPPTNQATNPPVVYQSSAQYVNAAGAPPPTAQYTQWTGQQPTGANPVYHAKQPTGVNPVYQPQQQIAPGYQYYPTMPQYYPQQPLAPLTSTPIPALNRGAAPVDCPVCGARSLTSTRKVVGSTNHLWAAIACFFFCLGCIPYLLDDLKDVEHSCSNCGTHLATHYNSGGTEAMIVVRR